MENGIISDERMAQECKEFRLAAIQMMKSADETAKEFCQDVSIALELRWDVFSQGFGGHESWIQHFPGEWDDILNDGEYVNRNQIVNVAEKINYQTEGSEKKWHSADSPWLDEVKVNALKEHVLKAWIKSYEFDW